jgi:hypothetical protein
MRVSPLRHASATGLSKPDTTCVRAIFTPASPPGAVVEVEPELPPPVAVVVGDGLVGGIGFLDEFDDEPLHAASASAGTSAPTTSHERHTPVRLRLV